MFFPNLTLHIDDLALMPSVLWVQPLPPPIAPFQIRHRYLGRILPCSHSTVMPYAIAQIGT